MTSIQRIENCNKYNRYSKVRWGKLANVEDETMRRVKAIRAPARVKRGGTRGKGLEIKRCKGQVESNSCTTKITQNK